MEKLEEFIFEQYLEIPENQSSYYGEFLKAQEIEREFESKLSPELKKMYIKVSDSNNMYETERLRELCYFVSNFYKNIFKR